jgi:LPXTG-motif cell wall-anchored protein
MQPADKPSTTILVSAIVGSLVGGILLSFGGFFLYKWNKNRKTQKNSLPIPGSEN